MPESVWDYPRPPRVGPELRRVRVRFAGETIVDSVAALRVLETSHPPGIYVPAAEVRAGALQPSISPSTICEWKGRAQYWDVIVGEEAAAAVAWSYPDPRSGYEQLTGYVSFYPGRVEACFVDEEKVTPQAGDFYGGWITEDVVGPFKGGPGTWGW